MRRGRILKSKRFGRQSRFDLPVSTACRRVSSVMRGLSVSFISVLLSFGFRVCSVNAKDEGRGGFLPRPSQADCYIFEKYETTILAQKNRPKRVRNIPSNLINLGLILERIYSSDILHISLFCEFQSNLNKYLDAESDFRIQINPSKMKNPVGIKSHK